MQSSPAILLGQITQVTPSGHPRAGGAARTTHPSPGHPRAGGAARTHLGGGDRINTHMNQRIPGSGKGSIHLSPWLCDSSTSTSGSCLAHFNPFLAGLVASSPPAPPALAVAPAGGNRQERAAERRFSSLIFLFHFSIYNTASR